MDTLSNRPFNRRGWGRGLKKSAVLGTALAFLLLFAGKGQIVHAASMTVTTTDDELNADGDCSLREAIQAANTDTAVDACLAGSGADTIIVPAGTYTLSIAGAGDNGNVTGDLDITSNVTIQGGGATETIIDGADLDRVLHILAGQVQISGVTIQKGMDTHGGGIWNDGTLTITYSTIADNSGGGIFNRDDLTLTNVTVEGNSAQFGSGISNSGLLTIYNSTIKSNSATNKGSGIFNHPTGIATIENSTISENTGTAISNEGTLTIIDSTFNDNAVASAQLLAGAIGNSGLLTLESSTFSGNSADRGSAIYNWGELNVTDSSFFGNIGDLGGSTISNAASGEVVIENSTFSENTCVGVENEGSMSIARSNFTRNTLGAFVNMPTGVAIVESGTFSENSSPDGGAINNFRGDLTLTDITVINNTAGYGGGVFNEGTLTITHSTIRENTATYGGGGIHNREGGVVTVDKSTIVGNSAWSGGGVDNSIGPTPGTVTITASQVTGNTALYGGGIFNETGTVTVDSGEIKYNTASVGGGIFNSDSLFLIKTVVTKNSATSGPGSGGGIFNNGAVTLTKSKVKGNQPDDCVGC